MDKEKLLELQRLFSEGKITEEDIPDEYVEDLETLYREQIDKLDEEILNSKERIRQKLEWLKKNNK